MSAFAKTSYFWRSALQGMWRAPFVHAVAVVTLAIALFVVGLMRGGALLVDRLLASLGGEVQLTVYAKPHVAEADFDGLVVQVRDAVGAAPKVVTPKEALERLGRELGSSGDVLGGLSENPLPYTLELSVPAARRSPAALHALADTLGKLPNVDSVDYGEEAVERLSAIARLLNLAGMLGLAVVFVATVVIVSATLQLAIWARREEVEIQKLVGATNRFVKAPFLIEGFLQGLLGSAVALAGLWGFFQWMGPHLGPLFGFLRLHEGPVTPLTASLALQTLGMGLGLGLGGSFVAVGRFLKV